MRPRRAGAQPAASVGTRRSPFSSASCSSPCRIRRPSRATSASSRSSTPTGASTSSPRRRPRTEPARNGDGPLACDRGPPGRIPHRVRGARTIAPPRQRRSHPPDLRRRRLEGERRGVEDARAPGLRRVADLRHRARRPRGRPLPAAADRGPVSSLDRAQHRHRQRRRLRRRTTPGAVRAAPRHPGRRRDRRRLAPASPGGARGRGRRRPRRRHRRLARRSRTACGPGPTTASSGHRSSTGRPVSSPVRLASMCPPSTASPRSRPHPSGTCSRTGPGAHRRRARADDGRGARRDGDNPHSLAGARPGVRRARSDRPRRASGRPSRYACRDDDERDTGVGGIAESRGHRAGAGGRHHALRRPAAARLVRRQVRHARPSGVGAHRDHDTSRRSSRRSGPRASTGRASPIPTSAATPSPTSSTAGR